MFRNKPTSRNKEKLLVVKKRIHSTTKMNADGGIFNNEKGQKIRDIGSSTSSRAESRHESQPNRLFSAGDNGASMLEAYKEEKVSLVEGARCAFPFDYIFVSDFNFVERWQQG